MRRLAPLLAVSAIALGLAGCRGSSTRDEPLDGGAGSLASNAARARLGEAVHVARVDARWTAALRPTRASALHVFRAAAAAFETTGLADAKSGVQTAFGGSAPLFGDGAIEAHLGDSAVSLRVHDARGVEGALIDGDVVYPDAHPATDFFVAGAPGRIESFWLLRDERAPTTFTFTLGLVGLEARVERGGIEFVDGAGVARLRLPTPTALDAAGTRRVASVHLEGETLTLSLDREGLAFPILLDPALEQVVWADVGLEPPAWPPPGLTTYPRIAAPAGLQRVSGRAQSGNGLVYLFGGATIVGSASTSQLTPYVTSLFEWNGTSWSASAGGNFSGNIYLGDPNHGTTLRQTDIIWDPTRKKLVMFGSLSFGPAEPRMGLWEYDPVAKTWTDQCGDVTCWTTAPPMPDQTFAPSGVYAFGKVVVVVPAGTFAWDPTAKVFAKYAATPDLKRSGVALAFDEARSRIVAYGDQTGLSDTWETEGTTWTRASITGPLGVANASLTYHKARKRVVLWASNSSTGGLWEWDGVAWTAVVVDGASPPPRPNAAFAYDEAAGKLLLVGGGDLGGSSPSNCFDSPYSNPFDNNRDFRTCARVDTWTSTVFGGACTTSADCATGTTCVDGVCCKTACAGACQNCAQTGSIGKCIAVVSADNPGTCSGTASCDPSGSCRKKQGQVCSIGTDCLSGNCADGYCCDATCAGSCEACNLAGKLGTCSPLAAGSTGKSCGLSTCSGASGACLTTCTADVNCAPIAFCDAAGKCVALQPRGTTCTRNRQCDTGVCADGVCCGSACAGVCDVCSTALGASANGTCTVLAKTASPAACGPAKCSGVTAACGSTCSVDGDCSAIGFCSAGVCVHVRKQGESCSRAAECEGGLSCADGVCCNATCDGACQACAALNKQSGDKSGECGPAAEGTNPGVKCAKSAVTTCGSSGVCDATGSCAKYAPGTACGATGTTSCVGDSVTGQTCDGLGACVLDTAGTPCSPAKCLDGACKIACTADADCAADGYCTGGVCKKRAAAGAKCGLDAHCLSGFCADGVCCNSRCDRSCEACDQAGTGGTCTAVTGKPRLGHPACAAGEPGNPCSAAACDGSDRATCAKKAGPEVTCRAGSCEAGVESLATTCDGSGKCPASEARPCQPFACASDACKKTCVGDGDCKSGFVCNTATGACTAGDKCAGSVVTHVDGTTTDCAPYVCESSGKCKDSCAASGDCVSPKVCDGSNKCVDPTDAAVDRGGGCATGSNEVAGGAAPLLLFLALVGRLGRRRPARNVS